MPQVKKAVRLWKEPGDNFPKLPILKSDFPLPLFFLLESELGELLLNLLLLHLVDFLDNLGDDLHCAFHVPFCVWSLCYDLAHNCPGLGFAVFACILQSMLQDYFLELHCSTSGYFSL